MLDYLSTRLPSRFERPATLDKLYKTTYQHYDSNQETCDNCSNLELVNRTPRNTGEPKVHYGTILSGNCVIKNAVVRDQLCLQHHALCFEMEAAGVINDFPCVVVRGICDYSDSHKNKEWQNYAAASAAAWARELLETVKPAAVETLPRAFKQGL